MVIWQDCPRGTVVGRGMVIDWLITVVTVHKLQVDEYVAEWLRYQALWDLQVSKGYDISISHYHTDYQLVTSFMEYDDSIYVCVSQVLLDRSSLRRSVRSRYGLL